MVQYNKENIVKTLATSMQLAAELGLSIKDVAQDAHGWSDDEFYEYLKVFKQSINDIRVSSKPHLTDERIDKHAAIYGDGEKGQRLISYGARWARDWEGEQLKAFSCTVECSPNSCYVEGLLVIAKDEKAAHELIVESRKDKYDKQPRVVYTTPMQEVYVDFATPRIIKVGHGHNDNDRE